ncbi:merozoite surface protein 10, putative [Plasmodium malariae]|uniref:Merozoite surface protein 10, putative n=1 Tax=Plasmodium malariae TaxID=5858 RepID=A0A1A8WY67_PLAMA|nr:merozoite surface protein 10, putative [Plasmodium malariae]SBS97909.1 merozoite surface protein 10, putative (MSP10) [Plasmodium malariae]SCO93179.1 merozoite surface protein 10, putative [Plasmodium malariae]
MIFIRWNKSISLTILLLLYLNNVIYINTNDIKDKKKEDVSNKENNAVDNDDHENLSIEGGNGNDNDNAFAGNNSGKINIQDDENAEFSPTGIFNAFEKIFLRKRKDNIDESDMQSDNSNDNKKNKNSLNASDDDDEEEDGERSIKDEIYHAFNYVKDKFVPFFSSKNQTIKAEDDDTTNPTEDNKDINKQKQEPSVDDAAKKDPPESKESNSKEVTSQKGGESMANTSPYSYDNFFKNKETRKPKPEVSEHIQKTLLKEGNDIKETTSQIDNVVYNFEQVILKTKFYTKAIKNFVHFKMYHICEYSKCGANARCYIVDKDKEECRCRANYVQDTSVDYFKCIPMTTKDCKKKNGNCDKNADCSTDKNNNIRCQCKHDYFGDGIFCVMGSQARQSVYLLLLVVIGVVQKFLF